MVNHALVLDFLMYPITTASMIIVNIENIFPDRKLMIPNVNPIIANPIMKLRDHFFLVNNAPASVAWIESSIQSHNASTVPRNPKPASPKNIIMITGKLHSTWIKKNNALKK